jgi:hypothetical protein
LLPSSPPRLWRFSFLLATAQSFEFTCLSIFPRRRPESLSSLSHVAVSCSPG